MKKITAFSKEALDGKLVNVKIGEIVDIGQIMYEDGADGENFYIYQNIEEGLESETLQNTNFKYSFAYFPEDIEIFEMSEEKRAEITEKFETFATLQVDDEIYVIGKGFRVIVNAETKAYNGGYCLAITDTFYVVKDRKEFIKKLFSDVLSNKYLTPDSKKQIQAYTGQGGLYTNSAISFEVNSLNLQIYFDDNLRIRLNSKSAIGGVYAITTAVEEALKPGEKTIAEFNEYMENIMKSFEKETTYSKSFRSLLSSLGLDEDIQREMLSGKYYHKMQFIDYNMDDKMIIFTPKGKQLIAENGVFTDKNRQSIKPHKFFNTVLKGKLSEYDIKIFVDKLLAYKDSYTVRYFRGKKMAENYSTVNTRLWATQSCMDRKAENFFEMYTDPRFRLGVVYRDKEIVARFIEVTADCGFVYNDRLYYKDEQVLAWYNSWVDKNKMNRKYQNNHSSSTHFYNVEKGSFNKIITVSLRKKLDTIKIYPYMDTLFLGYDNKLTNGEDGKVRLTHQFRGTGGKCERLNSTMDVITGKYIDTLIAVQITFGHQSGKYTTVDNLIYSAENGGHCLK